METVFRIDRKIRRQGLRDAGMAEIGTSEPLPLVDTRIDRLQHRDRYLLCTDGLANTVADKDIADLQFRGHEAAGIAEQLVAQALRGNARDNITAAVVIL
jgi:serine/threonine protein phosphatase PrpC